MPPQVTSPPIPRRLRARPWSLPAVAALVAVLAVVALVWVQQPSPASREEHAEGGTSPTASSSERAGTALPAYVPIDGMAGDLRAVGSDSMFNLMLGWSEGFKRIYPDTRTRLDLKGSKSAPGALIAGTADLGPMARPMRPEEVEAFVKTFGYEPTALRTAMDALAVLVHRDNPLVSLSLPQVDALFSKARRGGAPADLRTWGDLGLTGEWASQPVRLYGRNSASGTYGYFKEHALFKGDFKDNVKEQPGTSAVVAGVANDRYGIGYGGLGYLTEDVRAVPLSKDGRTAPVEASAENAYAGTYPLARFLLLYVNHEPGSELDPLRREFIRYVVSRQGQEVVNRDRYFPVRDSDARDALRSVGIRR